MTHFRTLVRHSVMAHLRAHVPSVEGRVHPEARSQDDLQPHDIPLLLVELGETEPQLVTKVRPRSVRRSLSISVIIVGTAFDGDAVDDLLDDISLEVEAALATPDFLPLVAHDWRLSGSTGGAYSGAEGLHSTLRLTYACSIASVEGRPDIHP